MNPLRGVRARIEQARQTLARYESPDPHTAGQVRRAVGGVLVADGVMGLENPFDGSRTRPGLFGAFGAIVFGLVLVVGLPVFLGLFTPDTDAETAGTVIAVDESTGSDGGAICSVTAEFAVGGETYTASSAGRSSTSCDMRSGDAVTVLYDSADPSRNTVEEPMLNIVRWVFGIVGVLVIISGVATLVVRTASIVVGVSLWRSGSRMIREHPGHADTDVVEEARRAITGLLTAGSDGRAEAADGDVPARVAAPPVPVAPSVTAVEPGWYLTGDRRHYRWHDGTSWTDHTRPAQD